MQWRLLLILTLIWVGMVSLVACQTPPDEPPPSIPEVRRVTSTLPAPFDSETPLPTASLTPSHTPSVTISPTVSDTPTPITPTLTPSATSTPPIRGAVNPADDNIRLRGGPGTEFDQVTSLPSGTQLDVIGSQRSTVNQIWYLVYPLDEEGNRLVDANGEAIVGWILGRLVSSAEEIPTLAPSPTATATQPPSPVVSVTVAASVGGSPTITPTITPLPISPLATPPQSLSEVNILAYCNNPTEQRPRSPIRSNQSVSIYWRWWVTEPYLMASHLENVEYEVTLNEELLDDWEQFRTEMEPDPTNNNRWTIYWYRPVGTLAPGDYRVEYKVSWSSVHNDGISDYGPGTDNPEETGTCNFTVIEAE